MINYYAVIPCLFLFCYFWFSFTVCNVYYVSVLRSLSLWLFWGASVNVCEWEDMYRRMIPWVHELVKVVDNSTVNHLDGISCGRMLDGLHTHCWLCWRYGKIPVAVNLRSFDFVLMCRCASGSSFNFSHVPNILKKSREDTRLHVAILPCDTFYHFQDVKRGYFEILSAVYFTFVTRNSRNKRSQGGVWQCSAGRRVFFFPFQYSRQRFYVAFCNTCCSKRH